MAIQVVSLEQYQKSKKIRGLVYANHFVGKTTFSCSSKTMRVFHMDVDDSLLTVACDDKIVKKNIHTVRIKDQKDFKEAALYFQSHISSYDLLVVDTLSQLQRIFIQEVSAAQKDGWPGTREWGLMLGALERVVIALTQQPVHLLCLAHEKKFENKLTGRYFYDAHFQGQFQDMYPRYFDWIGRMFLNERRETDPATGQPVVITDRWLRNLPNVDTNAKDRSGSLGEYEVPDIDAIFAKIVPALKNAV